MLIIILIYKLKVNVKVMSGCNKIMTGCESLWPTIKGQSFTDLKIKPLFKST
jgi:hypothetical protein